MPLFQHVTRSLLLIIFGTACATSLAADPSLLSIKHADIGFAGKYKSGLWTPVSLTLAAGKSPVSGELQLIAPDGDNVPAVFFAADGNATSSSRSLRLEPGKEAVAICYAKVGPLRSRLRARLFEPRTGKVLWEYRLPESLPEPLSATTPLVVTLGSSVGVEDALRFIRRSEENGLVAAEVASSGVLPDQWWGYEGVETIVVPTAQAGLIDQLSASQTAAILQWVREGGRLVISVGSRGEKLLTADSPWRSIIPGQLAAVAPMRDATSLESLAGEPFPLTDDASRPAVAQLTGVHGRIELSQGVRAADVPLVVRAPHGFGEVVFVALDLEGERLEKWAGRPRFLAGLLQGPKAAKQESSGGAAVTRLGYNDLTGQLRGALDQFPGVRLVNITTVSILIVVYILLIGPLEFVILYRLRAERSVTWVSFPLMALLFCGIAWYAGLASHGTAVRLNQAEIVDIDVEQGSVRGTAWMHLYSPETKTYDLALHFARNSGIQPSSAAGSITWQGLPGGGLGGLDARQVAPAAIDPYAVGEPGPIPSLHSLPLQVGSSKSLSARWWGEASLSRKPALKLNEHGLPVGDVVNPLDIDLQECILTYNVWMFRLKTLHAGESFSLIETRPLYLEARLQQHTGTAAKDAATPWLRDATDVPAILQMLMFHEAARGQSYTGLAHRYQPHLDLSGHLQNGRALLVGRAENPATELHVGGSALPAEQVQSWTYYRIAIPVSERGASAP